MRTPAPRGPLSRFVRDLIRLGASAGPQPVIASMADAAQHDDLQLALWMCYELHYRGFDDAASDLEWDPDVLRLRQAMENCFMADVLRRVDPPRNASAADVPGLLAGMTADRGGPSLSRHLQMEATREQFEEFVIHRSAYHLKEADPHSWAIPRLAGAAKAALVEIQYDEYGAGSGSRMHSELFRGAMRGLSLDDSYGAYMDRIPGATLSLSNIISLFGLHRRWRGALAGHLAAFEMTSSEPNRRYAAGFRRVGGVDAAAFFYDEHVAADAVHEQIAAHDLCGRLAADDPSLTDDILLGAAVGLALDEMFAESLLEAWVSGRTSLRAPAAILAGAS